MKTAWNWSAITVPTTAATIESRSNKLARTGVHSLFTGMPVTRFFLPVLPILAGILSFFIPPVLSAEAPAEIRPTVKLANTEPIPLTRDESTGLLIVQCRLNGIPCNLIVDTGASHTTFDAAFIRQHFPAMVMQDIEVNPGTNVKEAPKLFPAASFSMGGMEIGNFYGMVLNLTPIRKANKTRIDGILGMNYLAFLPFRISAGNAFLQFLPQTNAISEPLFPLNAILRESGTFDILCSLNGKKFPLLLDSGSSLSFAPASVWPEDAQAAEHTVSTADINGASRTPEVFKKGIPSTLGLGPDFQIPELSFMVTEKGDRNQIGLDTLKRFDIVVDISKGNVSAIVPRQEKSSGPVCQPSVPSRLKRES